MKNQESTRDSRKPFCRTDELCWTTRRLRGCWKISPENQLATLRLTLNILKYCTQKGGSLEATSDFETVCGGLRTLLGCAIPSQYSGVRCINRSTADVKHKLVTHFLFSECGIWHRACMTYLTYLILFKHVCAVAILLPASDSLLSELLLEWLGRLGTNSTFHIFLLKHICMRSNTLKLSIFNHRKGHDGFCSLPRQ